MSTVTSLFVLDAPRRRAAGITALLALTLTVVVAPPVAAGEVNDDFAAAISAKPLPFTHSVDTTGASEQLDEPDSACETDTSTVWYRFKSAKAVTVRASTIGSDYDTAVAIWSGTSLTGLSPVACNSDVQTGTGPTEILQSRVTWRAKAGIQYYIQVADDPNGDGGQLAFKLEKVTRPSNDDFSKAQLLGSLPFSATVDTRTATTQAAELLEEEQCPNSMATLWYRVNVPNARVVRADTIGTGHDTVLNVYTGASLGALDERGCNDDTFATGTFTRGSSIAWKASAGTDYYIQLGGYRGNNGRIPFHVRTVSPRANDDFANATVITDGDLPYEDSGNLRNATHQNGEPTEASPFICGGNRHHTVWYRFTAPDADPVFFQVTGPSDPRVAFYTGASVDGLALQGCGVNVNFSPIGGTTYYFQISSGDGESGPYDVSMQHASP